MKYYNSGPGINFAETLVLMLAPTGKAAYSKKGNTIHSVLQGPRHVFWIGGGVRWPKTEVISTPENLENITLVELLFPAF